MAPEFRRVHERPRRDVVEDRVGDTDVGAAERTAMEPTGQQQMTRLQPKESNGFGGV
jgi:hypothetical protein